MEVFGKKKSGLPRTPPGAGNAGGTQQQPPMNDGQRDAGQQVLGQSGSNTQRARNRSQSIGNVPEEHYGLRSRGPVAPNYTAVEQLEGRQRTAKGKQQQKGAGTVPMGPQQQAPATAPPGVDRSVGRPPGAPGDWTADSVEREEGELENEEANIVGEEMDNGRPSMAATEDGLQEDPIADYHRLYYETPVAPRERPQGVGGQGQQQQNATTSKNVSKVRNANGPVSGTNIGTVGGQPGQRQSDKTNGQKASATGDRVADPLVSEPQPISGNGLLSQSGSAVLQQQQKQTRKSLLAPPPALSQPMDGPSELTIQNLDGHDDPVAMGRWLRASGWSQVWPDLEDFHEQVRSDVVRRELGMYTLAYYCMTNGLNPASAALDAEMVVPTLATLRTAAYRYFERRRQIFNYPLCQQRMPEALQLRTIQPLYNPIVQWWDAFVNNDRQAFVKPTTQVYSKTTGVPLISSLGPLAAETKTQLPQQQNLIQAPCQQQQPLVYPVVAPVIHQPSQPEMVFDKDGNVVAVRQANGSWIAVGRVPEPYRPAASRGQDTVQAGSGGNDLVKNNRVDVQQRTVGGLRSHDECGAAWNGTTDGTGMPQEGMEFRGTGEYREGPRARVPQQQPQRRGFEMPLPRLPPLEAFKGGMDGEFRYWLQQFETAMVGKTDDVKLAFFGNSLRDKAARSWSLLAPEDRNDYQRAKNAMRQIYDRPVSNDELQHRLMVCSFKANEKVAQFWERLRDLWLQRHPGGNPDVEGAEELGFLLIRALPPAIQKRVDLIATAAHPPLTTAQKFNLACEFEAKMETTKPDKAARMATTSMRSSQRYVDPYDSLFDDTRESGSWADTDNEVVTIANTQVRESQGEKKDYGSKNGGRDPRDYNDRNYNDRRNATTPGGASVPYRRGDSRDRSGFQRQRSTSRNDRYDGRQRQRSTSGERRPVTCGNCGEKNHYARDCQARCRHCEGEEHTSKDCPKQQQKRQQDSRNQSGKATPLNTSFDDFRKQSDGRTNSKTTTPTATQSKNVM
jgi:Zinc knuckle